MRSSPTNRSTLARAAIFFLSFAPLCLAQLEDAPKAGADRDVPGQWVLLQGKPDLWLSPGGRKAEQPLAAEALDEVHVQRRSSVGKDEPTIWLEVQVADRTGWLPQALLAPLPRDVPPQDLSEIGREPVDRYRGISARYIPPDLEAISHAYDPEVAYRLRRESARAYERMVAAAKKDGIKLEVVSAYRSYEKQREIYLRKIKRSGWNQTTVAKPGHSEHQLGTVVDLTDGNASTLLRASFGQSRAGRWLLQRAPDFGFAISYTSANRHKTGYSPEPWHYRYFGIESAPQRHRGAQGR